MPTRSGCGHGAGRSVAAGQAELDEHAVESVAASILLQHAGAPIVGTIAGKWYRGADYVEADAVNLTSHLRTEMHAVGFVCAQTYLAQGLANRMAEHS